MAKSDTLHMWNCFYSQFQNSKTFSGEFGNETVVIQKAGTSLLCDTGKSFTFDLFKSCDLLGGDIIKFNYILWKLEEKFLPEIILKFDNFRNSSFQLDQALRNKDESSDEIKKLPITDSCIGAESLDNYNIDVPTINSSNKDDADTFLGTTKVETLGSKSKSEETAIKNSCKKSNTSHGSRKQIEEGGQVSVRRSGRSVKVSTRYEDVKDRILKTIKNESVVEETQIGAEIFSDMQSLSLTKVESKENYKKDKHHIKEHLPVPNKPEKIEEVENSEKRVCPLCRTELKNDISLEDHMQEHIPSAKLYSCVHCNESFPSLGSLCRHLHSHKGLSIKNPLCLFCGKTFKSEKFLGKHIRKRHRKDYKGYSFQCPKCPKSFKSKEQLKFHSVRHADVKPYSCEVCGKNFMRQKGLINHMRMHDGNGFMCSVCGKSFVSQRVLEDHLTIHTGERPHVCDVCGKRFRLSANLRNHKQVHNPSRPLQCPQCPKTFKDSRAFGRHMLMHSGERPWRCTVCGKGFVQEITLKKHMNLHNGENLHQCKICLRSFVDKWGLIKHSTIHTGERPYECSVCHRRFRIKRSLEDHIKLHDKSLRLTCPLCPKTFVEKRHLEHHLRVHRGEKPYVCEICGDRFVNSMSLKVHHRRHTGEKPYKCSYCPKTFNQHGTHAAHERFHRNERPYACDFCDAAFITHSQLNIHRRKHLNIRPYKCQQCDYAATTASLLKVHMLKHSSDKPFKCSLCPAAFKRQNYLDVHMRKHQAKEEIVMSEEMTSIIHISNPTVDQQAELAAPGTVTVVEVFQCSFCEASFPTQEELEKHMKRHEIIVVTAATNQDGMFEIPAIEGAHGASSEVAYDIVLL